MKKLIHVITTANMSSPRQWHVWADDPEEVFLAIHDVLNMRFSFGGEKDFDAQQEKEASKNVHTTDQPEAGKR